MRRLGLCVALAASIIRASDSEGPGLGEEAFDESRGRFLWKTRCEDRDFAYYIGTIQPGPDKSYMVTKTFKEVPPLMEKYIQYAHSNTGGGYEPSTQPGLPKKGPDGQLYDDPEPNGYQYLGLTGKEIPKGENRSWEKYSELYNEWFQRQYNMTPNAYNRNQFVGYDLTYYNCDGRDPEFRMPGARIVTEFLMFYPYQWVGATHDLYTCPPDSTLVGNYGPKSGGWQITGRRMHAATLPVKTKIRPSTEWNNTEIVPYTAMRVNKWRRPCSSELPPVYADGEWPYHNTPQKKFQVRNWDLCGYARGYCECRDIPKENNCRWCETFWGIPICAREDRLQPALDQCKLYWEGHEIGGDDIRNMTTGEIVPHIGDDGIYGAATWPIVEEPPGVREPTPKPWSAEDIDAWTSHLATQTAEQEKAKGPVDGPNEFRQRIKKVQKKYDVEEQLDSTQSPMTRIVNPFQRPAPVDDAWENQVRKSLHPEQSKDYGSDSAAYKQWRVSCPGFPT